jgi:hypothetical protein
MVSPISVYTTDPAHASGEFQRSVPAESLPCPTMRDYGLWYKMEDGNLIRVPYTSLYTRLTGGLYGTAIIGKPTLAKVARGGGARLLGLNEHIIDITYGFEGTRRLAREYSQQNDARLQSSGKTWYMAEDDSPGPMPASDSHRGRLGAGIDVRTMCLVHVGQELHMYGSRKRCGVSYATSFALSSLPTSLSAALARIGACTVL